MPWRLVSEGACAFFRTGSFTESVRFVSAIGDSNGVEDHQPAVGFRRGHPALRCALPGCNKLRGDPIHWEAEPGSAD